MPQGADLITFQEVARAYAQAHRPSDALKIPECCRQAGIQPDERLLSYLVRVAVNARMYDDALVLLGRMEAGGMQPLKNTSWRQKHWHVLKSLEGECKSKTADLALARLGRWLGLCSGREAHDDGTLWRQLLSAKADMPKAVEGINPSLGIEGESASVGQE